MKALLLLSVLMCNVSLLQAQTFNNIYQYENYRHPFFSDLIVHNDTIVGLGMAKNVEESYFQGLIITRFDTSGILLDSRIVMSPNGSHFGSPLNYGRITKSSRGGYIFTGLGGNFLGGITVKVSNELELEWIKEYLDLEQNGGIAFHDPIETSTGYLLYGTAYQQSNTIGIPIIYHIDENGDIIWVNYYGESGVDETCWWGVNLLNNETIVLGAMSLSDGTVIQKIDLQGNIIETWHAGLDSEIGYIRGMHVTDSGKIIVFAQKKVGEEDGIFLFQPTLSSLTSDFEIEWSFQFGHIVDAFGVENNTIWDIQSTSDGNYICAGRTRRYNPVKQAGWLFKFSSQGDSIWSHIITPPVPFDNIQTNWYGGVAELPGGNSYIVGGRADILGQGHMWLTKVDRNGCLDDFCPDIYVSTNEVLNIGSEGPLISPNPNRGSFQLSWDNYEKPFEPFTLTVYNTNGQPLWQQENMINASINLSFLPKGAYFLSIKNESGHWRQKWVHH
jgi:hypothetical protein